MEPTPRTVEQRARLRLQDRRRHGISATQLRRELRAADRRLFEAAVARRPTRRSWVVRTPLALCAAAGLALVAAGGAASATPPRHASDVALPAAPPDATPPLESRATSPVTVAPPAPSPTAHASAPVHPRRPRTRRERTAATNAPPARASREAPPKRDDRGVLVRLRFTWDDPFR